LIIDPNTRNVQDIKHVVAAAASSNSASRAQDFLKEVNAPSSAKAYGSYAELVADPDVDIIYIATPHSHHYQNAMLCLNAGKNVLCEKAFTTNAAQARKLVDVAKEKNLFLMEAVWTRYFPLSIYVRDLISSGKLGNVTRCFADLSINADPENSFADGKNRMVNPDLAGGPLLDLGVYALNWVMQCLYHTQDAATRQRPSVVSAVKRYEPTGCDEMCTMLLTFPRKTGGDAHGVASTSIRAASQPGGKSDTPAVRVQGDLGEVQVYPMIFRPLKTRLILKDGTVEEKDWPQPGPGEGSGYKNGFGNDVNKEGEGHGMFWEADDAARALVAGRKEGSYLGWDESVLIMEVSLTLQPIERSLTVNRSWTKFARRVTSSIQRRSKRSTTLLTCRWFVC
jgi:dihydrodiol dehydrogenase / D-xylose 1-dehydrogenase (NADP)